MKAVILLTLLVAASLADRTIHQGRLEHKSWIPAREDVHPHTPTEFIVHLKQRNLDRLEQLFWKISDPSDPLYRQHRTMQELNELTRPSEQSFAAVRDWLAPLLAHSQIIEGPHYFQVKTTAKHASALLKTSIRQWTSHVKTQSVIKSFGEYSWPSHLDEHVHVISGLTQLHHTPKTSHKVPMGRKDRYLGFNSTLTNLRQAYNIDPNLKATSGNTSQAILAFNDYFSLEGLHHFFDVNGIKSDDPISVGHNCLTDSTPPCDEFESDLDVQYMMGLAPGVKTFFVGNPGNYWLLEALTLTLPSIPQQPNVISVSYGSSEFGFCPGTVSCQNTSDASAAYVKATDVEIQKLGASGTTIMISSGDDGSSNFPNDFGNCPLTTVPFYCPDGGCEYNTSACQQVLVVKQDGSKVVFPNGVLSAGLEPAHVAAFLADNAVCGLDVDNVSSSLYSKCPCAKLRYKTYKNVNATLKFTEYQYNPSTGPTFSASWPATSPYVVSVGASILWSATNESVASTARGAVISSGGGFSVIYEQPQYQRDAVSRWSDVDRPPQGSYDTSKRGFPDLTLSGHNYPVATSKGVIVLLDGTSCSSPAFGGIISLITDELVRNGKKPLGFLNPLLYQADSSLYRDIKDGEIKCGTSQCCSLGYTAQEGWDPTSGFGSPNVGELRKYLSDNAVDSSCSTVVLNLASLVCLILCSMLF